MRRINLLTVLAMLALILGATSARPVAAANNRVVNFTATTFVAQSNLVRIAIQADAPLASWTEFYVRSASGAETISISGGDDFAEKEFDLSQSTLDPGDLVTLTYNMGGGPDGILIGAQNQATIEAATAYVQKTVSFDKTVYQALDWQNSVQVRVAIQPAADEDFTVDVIARRKGETTGFYTRTLSGFSLTLDPLVVPIDAATRAAGGASISFENLTGSSSQTPNVVLGPQAEIIAFGPVQVKFAVAQLTAPKDAKSIAATIVLTGTAASDVSVNINSAFYSTSVTIPMGSKSATVVIPITDAMFNGAASSSFTLRLSVPSDPSPEAQTIQLVQPEQLLVHISRTVKPAPTTVRIFLPLVTRHG